jgi:hypothetical protein
MKNAMKASVGAAIGLMLAAAPAHAAVSTFGVNFAPLNDSGVTGGGTLTYDDTAQTLTVDVAFSGLDEGPHPFHIHGNFAEGVAPEGMRTPTDSVTPTIAADQAGDNDGFIETMEGVPAYGDILLSLLTEPGNPDALLTSGADGTATYNVTFDLTDSSIFLPSPATEQTYEPADLFPLVLRELVIHGAIVPANAGGGDFEVNGENCEGDVSACYVALLPVASGEIFAIDSAEIPIPGAAILFGGVAFAGSAYRRMNPRKKA